VEPPSTPLLLLLLPALAALAEEARDSREDALGLKVSSGRLAAAAAGVVPKAYEKGRLPRGGSVEA